MLKKFVRKAIKGKLSKRIVQNCKNPVRLGKNGPPQTNNY